MSDDDLLGIVPRAPIIPFLPAQETSRPFIPAEATAEEIEVYKAVLKVSDLILDYHVAAPERKQPIANEIFAGIKTIVASFK